MKKSFFSEYWLYATVRLAGWGLRRLPVPLALACGRVFGTVASWVQPKRRAICLGNLKAAFHGARGPAELDAICRGVFQTIGMSFVEVLLTPAIDERYVDRWLAVEGREHFDRAVAARRGLVLVTGHFGNWELTNLMAGLKGYPLSVLARAQGLPRLNRMLNAYRESKGCQVISKGMAVRAMVRHLKTRGIVGILADQDGGWRGVLAPFFGRLASTAPGLVELALRMDCPILPAFIIRAHGPRHTIHLEPPLTWERSGDPARDVQAGVAAYLRVLEAYVQRAPEQWLWPHRRWKTSPDGALVVLTDGKAGHTTQARTVADLVQQVWDERVARDPRLRQAELPPVAAPLASAPRLRDRASPQASPQASRLPIRTIEIRYRSGLRRIGLAVAIWMGLTQWGSAWRWLRWALVPDSHQALEQAWATITVSCGAAAGLANAVWSRSMNARAIHVMRPPWPVTRRFSLRIVPRHDRIREDARTIVTLGALHGIEPSRAVAAASGGHTTAFVGPAAAASGGRTTALVGPAAGAAGVRRRWAPVRPVQIGLLLGGDSRDVRLTLRQVAVVLEQLLAAAQAFDGDILATTSRRTSSAVEQLVADRLGQHARCPLMIIASRDRTDDDVPGILAAARAIVVSGESISMVSEAVGSGKPVVVFEPECRRPWPHHLSSAFRAVLRMPPPAAGQVVGWPKYRRLLKAMEAEGHIRVARPEALQQALADVLREPWTGRAIDDRTRVLARLRQWL